jgi:hypothetical protein
MDPADYDTTVREGTAEDGKRYYLVRWRVKQPPHGWVAGGLTVFWVDPATGEVVHSEWYQ